MTTTSYEISINDVPNKHYNQYEYRNYYFTVSGSREWFLLLVSSYKEI